MREMIFGAHISVAGGLHQAFTRGQTAGCHTIQIFTKSERQWKAKPLTDESIAEYRKGAGRTGIAPLLAQAS